MASNSTNEVRILDTSEYKGAALALAEAFAEDDVARYFLDTPTRAKWTPDQKWQLHLSLMEYMTYAHCMRGLVTAAGDDYGSVALWMPPGAHMDDLWTTLRSGVWRLYYKLCTEGRIRFFTEFMPLLHDTKAAVLGDRDMDSYYLVYLGTRPQSRGQGLARKCVEHVMRMADAEGKACYLESSSVANVPIYRKMGFEIQRTIKCQRGERELPLDIMVREPRDASSKTPKTPGPTASKKAPVPPPVSEKVPKFELLVKSNTTKLAAGSQGEKGIVRGLSAVATIHAE